MDTEVAEPKPASWYGETKLAAELEVMGAFRLSGFPACSLRLFSVFGERERPEKLFPKLIRAIDEDSDFLFSKEASITSVRIVMWGIFVRESSLQSKIGTKR